MLAALYGLAMLTLPLAHVPMKPTPDLTAYALPDGTVPHLCAKASINGSAEVKSAICEACLLGPAVGPLPDVAHVVPDFLLPVRLSFALKTSELPSRFETPAQPRGPPLHLA